MDPLAFYRSLGPNTDPGEFADLYDGLPQSLVELCTLIKRQLIHPSQRSEYRKFLPPGAKEEDARFVSVQQILAALKRRNAAGLTMKRSPRQRLILSCRYHALLLVSILKVQGRPARVRVGFAGYLSSRKGKYIDHWICEVWEEAEQRWLLVDPDTKMVDFARDEFKLACDVWPAARDGFTYPSIYGIGRWWGWEPIRQNLIHDFESCLNREPAYWQGPPLFKVKTRNLSKAQYRLLDEIAQLLQNPDENLAALQALHEENAALQSDEALYVSTAVTPARPYPLTAETNIGRICLERARPEDAKALALVSWKAFDNDVHYGAPGKGGPIGYKSDKWQTRMMQAGDYYKIVVQSDESFGRIIGGVLVFNQADGLALLGRIFIHPDVQNQGVGTAVMRLLETAYPQTRCWRLGTPKWNKRNQTFYQKVGYVIVGEEEPDGVLFEKQVCQENQISN